MITLEQVKLLEEKVESLISVVKSLYIERDSLKGTLTQKEKRLEELESTLHSFEIAQAKIEESVMKVLLHMIVRLLIRHRAFNLKNFLYQIRQNQLKQMQIVKM